MPHIVIEYSQNLAELVDLPNLLQAVHKTALSSGVFPIGGVRTRAVARKHYLIADGHPDNAFVHVVVRLGHGRDLATKRQLGDDLFTTLCNTLEPVFAANPLGLSLEIQEIDPALSFKKNNLHTTLKQRANA